MLHSSHDAEGASFLHAALEGGQVVVLQLGKRDLRIEVVPRDNLAVNRRMLERIGKKVLALHEVRHEKWQREDVWSDGRREGEEGEKLEGMDGRTDGRADRRIDGRTDGLTDGRIDGWTDGWMDR